MKGERLVFGVRRKNASLEKPKRGKVRGLVRKLRLKKPQTEE
jgi:hypothetical protein